MPNINILRKLLSFNHTDYCGLCFQLISDIVCGYNLDDEIIIDTKTVEINNILLSVLGTRVSDMISSKLICPKCTQAAIVSYKFIEMCRNNFQELAYTVNRLVEHTKNSLKDDKIYGSIFLAIKKDQYSPDIYYDKKQCNQKMEYPSRFQHLQKVKQNENHSILNSTEYECENRDYSAVITASSQNKGVKRKRFVQSVQVADILHENNDQNNYKCKHCFKIYVSILKLKQHYFRVHAPKTFKCYKCLRSFGSPMLLSRHIKDSHCKVVCSQCGKTYNNIYSLRHHEKNHKTCLVCHTCGKVYKGKQSYNNHIAQKLCQKPRKSNAQAKFTCDHCQKKYSQKTALSVHIRLEHDNGRAFICDWCGKKLSSLSRLKDHSLKHTKEKNFQCNLCGDKFVTKVSLLYHTRLHTGEKPYKCENCDMRFLSASRRSEHVKRNHSGPDLVCDICCGKFKGQTCLVRHRKRHFNAASRLYHYMTS